MDNIDRILLFLMGICVMLMSIVTLADPDGYYMQSIEGIFITLFIKSICPSITPNSPFALKSILSKLSKSKRL